MTRDTNPSGPAPAAPATPSGPAPATTRKSTSWGNRIIIVLVILAVAAVTVALGIAVLPRWWAHRIGQVADGSMIAGSLAGASCGVLFTAIPLLLLRRVFVRHSTLGARFAWLVAALLLAVPNLLTLGIVLGSGNAAHAGERTLDVDAPGFRGGSVVGAVIGAVLVLLFWVMMAGRRRRARELERLRTELSGREAAERQAAQRRLLDREAAERPVDSSGQGS